MVSNLGQTVAGSGLLNDQLSTDDNGRVLLSKFRELSSTLPDSADIAKKEWEEMYVEFNRLQKTKDNKIPQSEFEAKYSKFYNPENIGTFTSGSVEAAMWKEDSEEFLRRINPYCPIYIVDDDDPNKVLRTLLPLFRESDTLNNSIAKGRTIARDEEGNPLDTAYLTGVVNNVFDKLGNHQLPSKRREGAKILNQCIMHVQDEKKLVEDVRHTDVLIKQFVAEKAARDGAAIDTEEHSSEEYGISFE